MSGKDGTAAEVFALSLVGHCFDQRVGRAFAIRAGEREGLRPAHFALPELVTVATFAARDPGAI